MFVRTSPTTLPEPERAAQPDAGPLGGGGEVRLFADHHDHDTHELDELVARLDLLDVQSDAWLQLFEELVAAVKHHAEDEETRIFPLAPARVDEAS